MSGLRLAAVVSLRSTYDGRRRIERRRDKLFASDRLCYAWKLGIDGLTWLHDKNVVGHWFYQRRWPPVLGLNSKCSKSKHSRRSSGEPWVQKATPRSVEVS